MARPRVCDENRVATAVRLPVSLHRRLRTAAASKKVSVNQLVTAAVTDFLASEPAASDPTRP